MIEVRLFATLRAGREKIYRFPADGYQSVTDVIRELDIPAEEVALIIINGFHSKIDDGIKDGDVVSLFPPVAGG